MTLFVNACVGSQSRTEQIARAYLRTLTDYSELVLNNLYLEPLDDTALQNRNDAIARGDFGRSYFALARQFAEADEIVIAAPFWDLSFPAKLRIYLENICITGLTFRYTEEGIPVGLCKAQKLTYITTSGGPYMPEFSFQYVKALAQGFFGIDDVRLIYAENLDIVGNDPQAIVAECIEKYCQKDEEE